MADSIKQHRANLGDLAPLAADLLRDVADLKLTPQEVDELSYYLDDNHLAQVDFHVEDLWRVRTLERQNRRVS